MPIPSHLRTPLVVIQEDTLLITYGNLPRLVGCLTVVTSTRGQWCIFFMGHNGEETVAKEKPGFLRFAVLRLRTLILIGCLLSIAGYFGVRSATESQIRNDFLRSSETRVQLVQRELEDSFGVLKVLQAYFESPKEDGPASFDRFAGQTISAYRNVRSLEWAPRVRDPDRSPFEARLSARSPGTSGIVAATSDGKAVRVTTKPEYFPVEFVYPWSHASSFLGSDMMSNPATAPAVRRAIATGQPSSSGRLKLADSSGDAAGFVTFLAVYDASD